MATDPIYYKANRELILTRQKAYYHEKQANNPEYIARRKEYMREYMREYSKKHRSLQKENKILMTILV